MDQARIGKFIAEMRKAKRLTQRQLADALAISDKTVSKWECGKGLPEVSLMLPLCEALEITVNDLLSGERVSGTDYQRRRRKTWSIWSGKIRKTGGGWRCPPSAPGSRPSRSARSSSLHPFSNCQRARESR